jgi:hypothetical protein
MTDWATISALATAGGTLVLAAATFSSVRSSNRSARATERALLAALRPVLVPSRLQDEPQKVGFSDDHFVSVGGGRAIAEVSDDAIYLAMSLRNVGNGLGVLDRWDFHEGRASANGHAHADPETFQRLTRDIYVPTAELGFWQGAFRDPAAPEFVEAKEAISARRPMTIDLLYGDHEGGQRTISRFTLLPAGDDQWLAIVSRHWNLDRADPR